MIKDVRICSSLDCSNKVYAKGLCEKCYNRQYQAQYKRPLIICKNVEKKTTSSQRLM